MNPCFTVVAAITLALSILGNTPACGHPDPDASRAAPALPATNSVLGTKAGQEKVIGGVRLGWCPPGKFRMGSPAEEPGHRADESTHETRHGGR